MSNAILYCSHCGAAQPSLEEDICCVCQSPLGKTDQNEDTPALLAERYRPVKPVGVGGFGVVYEAWDTHEPKRKVAIKAIYLDGLTAVEIIEATDSFNRELSLLTALDHPSLPCIYDHFTDPQHWYLVMQFIDGKTLDAYVNEQPVPGHLAPSEAFAIALQLCDVLHYLHTCQPPIIFRDLKPGNVMRTSDGQIYLIDFGIARRYEPTHVTDTIPLGSPGFASPEQYGNAQTTPRSDIFSFGALLHFLLTGYDPSDTPFFFPPLPPIYALLTPLLDRMLAINSNDRPASIQEVREELQRLAQQPSLIGPGIAPGPRRSYLAQSPLPTQGTHTEPKQYQVLQSTDHTSSQKQSTRGWKITRRTVLGAAIIGTVTGIPVLCSVLSIHTGCLSTCPPPPPGPGEAGHTIIIYRGHHNAVQTVAWSPDNKLLASGDNDRLLQVWEAATGKQIFACQHNEGLQKVVWSPNGKYIATSVWDGTVHIWDAHTGKESGHWRVFNGYPIPLAWSPDSTRLLSANVGGIVHLLHLADQTQEILYQESNSQSDDIPMYAVAWAPDGKSIAFSLRNEIHIWDMGRKSTIAIYRGHLDDVSSVAWSPDGKRIASGANDLTAQIWSLSEATYPQQIFHEESSSQHENVSVAWSPDGKRLATCSWNARVRVWNTKNGHLLFVYGGFSPNDIVTSVAWSPDGKYVAATSLNNEVHIWKP